MNVNGVTSQAASYQAYETSKKSDKNTKPTNDTKVDSQDAAVYESSQEPKSSSKVDSKVIEQLKADAEQKTAQFRSLVEQMMLKQNQKIQSADDMWKFLASGEYEVDEFTKLQAQADIAEDGYWGVNQTSDRILDFAKALASNDPEKADMLMDAFKKGYEAAEKTWGKALPDICKQTYDAVLSKFDAWKNGTESNADTQVE